MHIVHRPGVHNRGEGQEEKCDLVPGQELRGAGYPRIHECFEASRMIKYKIISCCPRVGCQIN